MGLREEALSALDWWRLAGVDVSTGEAPRDWLAAPRPARPIAEPTAATALPAHVLPATIGEMRVYLETSDVFGSSPSRVFPRGNISSALMLMVDRPSLADVSAGRLLSGEEGALLDAMLHAIGHDGNSVYLASLAPTAQFAGELDDAALARIAFAHAALIQPKVLLLLGDAPSRSLLGMGHIAARGAIRHVNRGDVSIAAIATYHPQLLLRQPARKADAWRDLRLAMGELVS